MENASTTSGVPLKDTLIPFLARPATSTEKIRAVQTALEGADGKFWRKELGKWAASMVPVELLVPEVHRDWRPLVHESILFVVWKLAASRLAPKIIEQMELGAEVPAEARLLRFIEKVPGLQKIGQVLARNRHLDPRLRRALIQLENGIADVSMEEIRSIVHRELHPQIEAYAIRLEPEILSEASVSAVVAFAWQNPATGRRERGVFKVLKPHIPGCYAEDMKILGQLARHLARRHRKDSSHLGRLADTLAEIRLLLEREVDFPREQATLANALGEYRHLQGVRIPQVIPLLSTATITALTFERGKKVADARVVPAKLRLSVAGRLARTLLAIPAFSRAQDTLFHADPHAGNLLYDRRRNELVILDWALTERLTRKQRRSVVLLVFMLVLRDAIGMEKAIQDLCQLNRDAHRELRTIRMHIEESLDALPLTELPGPMHAMRLLDAIALDGIRFPAALLMFRKAVFTLEGVVEDVARARAGLDSLMANQALANWKDTVGCLLTLLSASDWVAIEWSALTFASRICVRSVTRPLQHLAGLSAYADVAYRAS
jgi:ubiquinone biosynthesis protein